MTSLATDSLIEFVNTFKFDDDLLRLPLPDSVRKATGINHKLQMISATSCITTAIFAPNNWTSQEDIVNDPSIPFPDLTKLADAIKNADNE